MEHRWEAATDVIIRYRFVDGVVKREILASSRHKRGEERPPRHFSERLLRSYYDLECSEGSRFRSSYSKNQIKRVHETALARYDETGVES